MHLIRGLCSCFVCHSSFGRRRGPAFHLKPFIRTGGSLYRILSTRIALFLSVCHLDCICQVLVSAALFLPLQRLVIFDLPSSHSVLFLASVCVNSGFFALIALRLTSYEENPSLLTVLDGLANSNSNSSLVVEFRTLTWLLNAVALVRSRSIVEPKLELMS